METITVKKRGTITLPKKLRDSLELLEGQPLRVETKNGKIILDPISDFDRNLLQDIKSGLQQIQDGKYIEFGSIKEFHKKIMKYEDKANGGRK